MHFVKLHLYSHMIDLTCELWKDKKTHFNYILLTICVLVKSAKKIENLKIVQVQ